MQIKPVVQPDWVVLADIVATKLRLPTFNFVVRKKRFGDYYSYRVSHDVTQSAGVLSQFQYYAIVNGTHFSDGTDQWLPDPDYKQGAYVTSLVLLSADKCTKVEFSAYSPGLPLCKAIWVWEKWLVKWDKNIRHRQ